MPKVDFALHFEADSPDFPGISRFDVPDPKSNSTHHDYISATVDVDEATAKAIELSRRVWGETSHLPPAYIDNTEHGEDRGLVVKRGAIEEVKVEGLGGFVNYELRTRISFGADRGQRFHDLANPTRFHIGVCAVRQFFPTEADYKSLGLAENEAIRETLNYSLRWLDGKFDDWSDPDEWEFKPLTVGLKAFHETRTVYASSCPVEVSGENTTSAGDIGKVKRLVELIGRKDRVLDVSPRILDPKLNDEPGLRYAGKLFSRLIGGAGGRIPIVGSYRVEEILRQFGLRMHFSSSRSSPTPMGGVEYVFGPILDAMEKFAKS